MSPPVTSIVITSIFAPTKAVTQFAFFTDYQVIVVGDAKSPPCWEAPGVTYLTVADQEAAGFVLTKELPLNHYARKMVGYLVAMRAGAQFIIDTDDDNVPYAEWAFPLLHGPYLTTPANRGFVNIYRNFTQQHIWPRGYPLDLILRDEHTLKEPELTMQEAVVGIWQGLADGSPDVDAIYRLVNNTPVFFDKRAPIVLAEGTLCPFNSQNTLTRRELFPLLYLPAYVTFRFTDILRGLVAQPIMWVHGYRLGFTAATVVQERNPHDYMQDFASEIPVYLHPNRVLAAVSRVVTQKNTVSENLRQAYAELAKEAIVTAQEVELLDLWLADVESLTT